MDTRTYPRGIARLRDVRWVGAGLLDQVVIASANAGTTLLGLILLDRGRAGLMVLALGIGYCAMYLNRAFVGDVLVALSSRYDDERRDQLTRDGLAAALTIGLLASAIFVGIWAGWPADTAVDLRYLIWLAPFLPAIMLHDTARCVYLAARRPERALQIDLVWVGAQAVAVTTLILTGTATPGGLLAAWGIGATAGAAVYLARAQARPWRGDPRRWVAATRALSGWFTATAVVGQLHVQAVNFLVAVRLSPAHVSGLRFSQTVLLQPVQNLISAAQGLVVPRYSRTAHAGQRPGAEGRAAAATLHRQVLRLALGFAALGAGFVLLVWPLAQFTLVRLDKFADVAPLALPVSLQAAIYLVQLPFAAALRGMHRARMLFGQYVITSAVGLSGLVIGASTFGLLGAVWGLVTGAAVGLAVMVGCAGYALRELARPEPAPVRTPTPAPERPQPVPAGAA